MTMQAKYDVILKELSALSTTVGLRMGALETGVGEIKSDISEIKGDFKELHKCYTEIDKRTALLEKNGLSLHTQLDESKADRKILHDVVAKLEMNWAKLLAVSSVVAVLVSILSPSLGRIGEAIVGAMGGK